MSQLISAKYTAWEAECESRFQQLKQNEEELNRIFIDIYGLQDELTPEVADKDITVHRVFDRKEDVPESMKGSNYVRTMRDEIVSLISYAVGCMFGRYSLDVEGLAFAGGEFSDQWVVVSIISERWWSSTLMDLAGAAVLEGIVKNQVKKDIRDGKGKESVRAAQLVFGSGAMRGGSRGIVNLGGLRGVDKAISEVQREGMPRQSQATNYAAPVDGFPVRTFVNDNRYAWRLNCEDGSAYGIDPEDYETRKEYNAALKKAKEQEP